MHIIKDKRKIGTSNLELPVWFQSKKVDHGQIYKKLEVQ